MERLPGEEGLVAIQDWVSSARGRLELLTANFRLAHIRTHARPGRYLGLPHSLLFNAVLPVDMEEPSRRDPHLGEGSMKELAASRHSRTGLLPQRRVGREIVQVHSSQWLAFPDELSRPARPRDIVDAFHPGWRSALLEVLLANVDHLIFGHSYHVRDALARPERGVRGGWLGTVVSGEQNHGFEFLGDLPHSGG